MKQKTTSFRFYLLPSLLLLLVLTACNKNKFHVEGTITEAKDSILYFENMSLDGPQVIDSVKLDDKGEFSFSGDGVEAPEFYRLRIANNIINVCIDSTETVTFKAKYPSMAYDYEVKGSDDCAKIKELSLLQMQLLNRAIAIQHDGSIGMEMTEDSIKGEMEIYKNYVRMNYIFKEPQKAYAYFALFQTLGNNLIFNPRESDLDIKTFGAVATAWDTYYPNSLRGENLHNIALEGQKALRARWNRDHASIDASKVSVVNCIDVPLPDNKGKMRSLKELSDKVVLLDFHVFASDGSTKRIMMLRDLYNKYHDKGFEIYQVSLDPDEHFWLTQVAALPWVNVRDADGVDSKYVKDYNVQSVPTFFLIGRGCNLDKRDVQIKNLDDEIRNLLQK